MQRIKNFGMLLRDTLLSRQNEETRTPAVFYKSCADAIVAIHLVYVFYRVRSMAYFSLLS